ncbi:MAG: transposase [Candidatus Thermoplasmatota archaeon]|nr:transposase [Candidatus Thermoplasmatota archaeon]
MRTPTSIKNLCLADIVGLMDFRSIFQSSKPKTIIGRPVEYHDWQLMAAIFIQDKYQIESDKELERQLRENPVFQKFCGFIKDIPSHDTINRFKAKTHLNRLRGIFNKMDGVLTDLGAFDDDDLCIDGTDIGTNANPRKRTDSEAGIGHTSLDETFYGYWAMIAVGSRSELPREIILIPGDRHQSDQALELIPMLEKHWTKTDCSIIMDGIFDTKEIYEICEEHGYQPVIKYNPRKSKKSSMWELEWDNWRFDHNVPPKEEWRLLYNLRVASERFNSRIKELLNVRNVRVKGKSKVLKHVLFSAITLQTIAIATHRMITKIKKWKQEILPVV